MAQIQPTTTYEYLLYTTVRLEFLLAGGPSSVGTGFIYDHHPPAGAKVPLLVTNRHVVKGSVALTVKFHERDTAATRWAVNGYVDLSFSLPESS